MILLTFALLSHRARVYNYCAQFVASSTKVILFEISIYPVYSVRSHFPLVWLATLVNAPRCRGDVTVPGSRVRPIACCHNRSHTARTVLQGRRDCNRETWEFVRVCATDGRRV